MRSLRLALVVAVAVALATGTARAQSTTATTFVAVDGIRYSNSSAFYVTGVVQGEGSAREVTFYRSTSLTAGIEHQQSCERFLLLAMSKPGQYLVTLTSVGGTSYATCTLTRVSP